MNHVFCHRGDLGDIVACLPTIRALGGGSIVIGPQTGTNQGRESLKGGRFEAIRPLLESQPYIDRVEWSDTPRDFTHDFTDFRQNWISEESLLDWQARHLSVKASTDPWLAVFRSPVAFNRIVIARSLRYHNPIFPWFAILAKHKNPLFVGTKEEHSDFERKMGRAVEHHPTQNLLELAEVIAGTHLFVGNQSCPFWIAAGLGVPLIQESWPHSPNSQIKRPNARYALRGAFIP